MQAAWAWSCWKNEYAILLHLLEAWRNGQEPPPYTPELTFFLQETSGIIYVYPIYHFIIM
jgi:hypothetical protein